MHYAGAAGITSAANMSRLKYVNRIPKRNLSRTDIENVWNL